MGLVARAFPPNPLLPGHELHANTIIIHDQISVVVKPNCVGFNFLHFLSHQANISCAIAPFVAEAIELKTVVEPHQRHDVFFQADVGTTSATTATSATSAAVSATATMSATCAMSPTGTVARMGNAMTTTAGTRMATTLMRRTGPLADVVFSF